MKPADSNLDDNFLRIKLNVNHTTFLISHKRLIIDIRLTLLVQFSEEPKIDYLDFVYSENHQITNTKPFGHSNQLVYRLKKTLKENAIEKQDESTGYCQIVVKR